MKNISPIVQFESMHSWNQLSPEAQRKRNPKKKKREATAKKRFFALSRFINDNLLALLAKNSPLRLRIYQKKDDIFMDITTLTESKKNRQFFERDITHDDVGHVIRRIHSGMGFVVDYTA